MAKFGPSSLQVFFFLNRRPRNMRWFGGGGGDYQFCCFFSASEKGLEWQWMGILIQAF